MGTIGYGYGSEWHLLRYLGYHRDELSRRVLAEVGGDDIHWLDQLFGLGTIPLHADREWRGLEFIDDPAVQQAWRAYWPQTGSAQSWDAVATIRIGSQAEWLLVEAKAHTGEVRSACAATSPESLARISAALRETSRACGSTQPIDNWLDSYYQSANRLAMLHFLTNVCRPSIPAQLLFIYFTGDSVPGADCPQSANEWLATLAAVEQHLGIDPTSALSDRVHKLFLPVAG